MKLSLRGLQTEQSKNFRLVQSQIRRRAVLGNNFLKEPAFVFEHFADAALDGVFGDKSSHEDGTLLPNAVSSIDGLVLDSGIPPAVEQDDIVGKLQVKPDAAG